MFDKKTFFLSIVVAAVGGILVDCAGQTGFKPD